MTKSIDTLVQRGGLSRFYKFQRIYQPLDMPEVLTASCDIVRRQDFIEPLHSREYNAKIPIRYYSISPFTPNEKIDFHTLDRILDNVDEPVVISVRVQPTDISVERHAMTGLRERFHSINHGSEFNDDDYARIDYVGGEDHKYFSPHK